jgi:hypothetical protein
MKIIGVLLAKWGLFDTKIVASYIRVCAKMSKMFYKLPVCSFIKY